tara:strand:+ start:34 stop:234 length:201 start_codon:yes stop_codon:yes gene_type:complete
MIDPDIPWKIVDLVWTTKGIGIILDIWPGQHIPETMLTIYLQDGSTMIFTTKEICSTNILIEKSII